MFHVSRRAHVRALREECRKRTGREWNPPEAKALRTNVMTQDPLLLGQHIVDVTNDERFVGENTGVHGAGSRQAELLTKYGRLLEDG